MLFHCDAGASTLARRAHEDGTIYWRRDDYRLFSDGISLGMLRSLRA
jgi:hypothetical protein